MKNRSSFTFGPAFFDALSLVLLVLAMCSQLDVRHVGPDAWAQGLGFMTKTLAVAASDVVFAAALAWFLLRTASLKAWNRLWWPPLACWALVLAVFVSLIHSNTIHASVVAAMAAKAGHHHHVGLRHALITDETRVAFAIVAQFVGYFLFAPWLFVNLLHDRREGAPVRRHTLALWSLLAVAACNSLLGVVQAFKFHRPPLPAESHIGDVALSIYNAAPRGLFGSPYVYGAVLCFVLPLLWAWVVSATGQGTSHDATASRDRQPLGLIVVTLATAGAGFTLISFWALLALALGGGAAVWYAAPRARATGLVGLFLAAALLPLAAPTRTVRDARVDTFQLAGPTEPVKRQFIEWQAAIAWAAPREATFATGVGPGNYQLNIGPYYGSLPAVEKMPPDSDNLYLVQAVSLGVLGLGALLWVLGHFSDLAGRSARRIREQGTSYPLGGLSVGVVAALGVWLFVNLFHALIVRGAGLILAFVFAIAVVAASASAQTKPTQSS